MKPLLSYLSKFSQGAAHLGLAALVLLGLAQSGRLSERGVERQSAPHVKRGAPARLPVSQRLRRDKSGPQAQASQREAGIPVLETLLWAQALSPLAPEELANEFTRAKPGAGLRELGLPPGSPFQRRTLSALQERLARPLPLVALRRSGGAFVLKPPPGTRLKKGDVLILWCGRSGAAALAKALKA